MGTYILITNKYIEVCCYYFELETDDNFHRKKKNNNYFDCLPWCLNVSHHCIPKFFYVV